MRRPFRLVWLLLIIGLLGACESDPSHSADEPIQVEMQTVTARPTLRFNNSPDQKDIHGTIEVLGLDADALARLRAARLLREGWIDLLAVYTGEALPTDPTVPPMLGTYMVRDDGIRFTPRFPLAAGLPYTARFDQARFIRDYASAEATSDPDALTTTFTLPKLPASPSTVVTHIYPTTDVLPMNQLKMYVHFSAPMRRGEAYDHIRLFDADTGEEVADPFVVIEQELWDAERTRFTLLFDPGRIKRHVRPNLDQGLPLQAGKRYRLVVDAPWRDAAGNPLLEPYEKAFAVTEADRTSPDYATWDLAAPQAGTTAAVTLTFQEPLDHALLQRVLLVRDAQNRPVEGRIEVTQAESHWSFFPTHPWNAGSYVIEVDALLEDLAGNNLRHVFDVDLNEQTPDRSAEQVPVRLPFAVKPSNL